MSSLTLQRALAGAGRVRSPLEPSPVTLYTDASPLTTSLARLTAVSAAFTEPPTDHDAPTSSPSPVAVLVVAIAAAFMAIVATSSLNVALPAIGVSLGVEVSALHWVVTAYMVSFTAGSPLAGWLGDARGPRTVITASLSIFLLGSCVGALATSYPVLVAGRIAQGVAASAIMPVTMILVTEAFAPERRGRAIGIWAVGALVGPILGPTLGGVLVERLSWRWVLGFNVPVAAVVIALVLWLVPRRRRKPAAATPFDGLGYGLLAAGIAMSVTALASLRGDASLRALTWPCAAAGAVALAGFLWRQRVATHPLYPREMTGDSAVRAALSLSVVRSVALFGPLFLLPIMLQKVIGYSAETTGLMIAIGALAIGGSSPIAGRCVDRWGPRGPAVVGVLLVAWSLWAYRDLTPDSGWWPIVWPMLVRGAGLALLMNASSVTVINRAESGAAGRGASLLSMSNQVCGATAIAGLNVVVAVGIEPLRASGATLLGSLAAAQAFDQAFVVAAGICALGLVPVWWLPGARPVPR